MTHTKEDIEAAREEVSLMLDLDKKTGINNPYIADGRRKLQVILAALEAYKPVDVDMLKKEEGDYLPTSKREREFAARGWNKCIDYLVQKGIINGK
jgi:nitrate reductase assembly molybdenum cofactor insertion protein NarJ